MKRRLWLRVGLAALAATSCEETPPPKAVAAASAVVASGTDLPWPLPLPSTSMEIPPELRVEAEPGQHLTVAADRLVRALRAAGYNDLRFYDIPDGFALVTPLELIDDQGQATAHPDPKVRFSAAYPPEGFFTMRFWSDLLSGKPGRFRLFVFVVISHGFGYCKDVTDAEIVWKHPSSELPLNRADLAYTAQDHWYALVYEVVHPRGTDLVWMAQNPSDPALHFSKSGIMAALLHLQSAGIAKTSSH